MRLFICLNLLWILSFSAVACLIASIATKNWLVNEKEDLHIGLYNFCTETRCVIKNVFRAILFRYQLIYYDKKCTGYPICFQIIDFSCIMLKNDRTYFKNLAV